MSSRVTTTIPGAVCGSMVNTVRSLAWELVCIRALSLAHCSSSWCWKCCRVSSILVCHGSFSMPMTWTRFLSPILSQVTWEVTWPRLRSQVTCGVFCLCFLKWLQKSLGPKSLGLFWNPPYCFPTDALFTSPCITVNTIVTSRLNTIVASLNAAPSQPTMPMMLSQPMASHP